MYDLIILGGGPAGTTAAVYASRKKTRTLLLTKNLGGQVNYAPAVENYLGFQYIGGPELMRRFEDHIKRYPVDTKVGPSATGLWRKNDDFEIQADDGQTYSSRAVIVATGKRPRSLGVPGEEKLVGWGISYCEVCDGPLFTGKKVAVVGGGNSALEAVNDLLKIAEHVYLISITPLTADPVLIERANKVANLTVLTEHEVVEVQGDRTLEGVAVRSGKSGEVRQLPVAGLFVQVGMMPNSGIVKGLVRLNRLGEVRITPRCETNVPGLFAAGDVTDIPEKQIIIAAGEGAKAALQAHHYLQRLR